ncbi:OprD family outer membrane porin [Sulfuricurvum sp.]|uniref:OprD family outer membrane porin n=1 Tax=Sulfuricurvum sp. TaxID=2025608 RepID=UPI002E381B5F|nr:OprD family outer membrane porin [Sulfuricurvum sp.]HEX5328967.1 OprD family outer membrane porin [Sulfuricurvum sp.]
MTKLSFATALLLGTAVFASAADDLASAFKEGKLDGRLRAQYFATDWDNNSAATGKGATDAIGMAIGGSLNYKTASLYGFSAAAGLYTTQNPGGWTEVSDGAGATTSKDLFSRDISRPTSAPVSTAYGKGYAVLAQAYLQYDIAKTKLKAGRMLMSNPWISPNDTKMIPIAIEGFEALSNDVPNTTIQIDYADKIKERGMTYFANMADTGDTPDKIAAYYTTHYGTAQGQHGDAPDVLSVGIKNKSIDSLELQAWVMHWADLVDEGILEANYALEAGDAIVSFGGRYIKQNDKGAGAIILPKTNNYDGDQSVDTSLFALRTAVSYGAAKLTLATSHTSSDGDLIAPWRGFPTDGYTRSMTQTDWNANTRAYKGQLDYDFNGLVSGLSSVLSYAYYDRDPSKKPYQSMTDRAYQNGDTHQTNLDVMYKLSGSWKGTEFKVRLMNQDNDKTALYAKETSNREMRLEANYFF